MIADSIEAVDRAEWNVLAARAGFFSSHEWLTTVEPETDGRCRYLLVRQNDRLVAAMPVYVVDTETNMFYRPAVHLDRAPAGRPTCLAGSHRGYRNGVLVHPGLASAERTHALDQLAKEIEQVCADVGVSCAYFLFVAGTEVATLGELAGCAPPTATYAAESRLAVVGAGFDDYLASLTPTRRKTARKEIRRFAGAGLTVSTEPVLEHRELLIRLVANLNRKYGRGFTEDEHAAALDRQQEHLAGHAVLFVCRAGAVPVGVTMGFVWNDWLYLWYAGFDYERLPGAYEYFNMAIYEPLRYCYERGLSGVHLGVGTHHAKGVRGASVEPLLASAWSASRLDDLTSVRHRDRVNSYWRAQMRLMPRAFAAESWREVLRDRPEGS